MACQVYNNLLGSSFALSSPTEFEKYLGENINDINNDRNLGLMKIIKDGLYWKKLKVLRSTYAQYRIRLIVLYTLCS